MREFTLTSTVIALTKIQMSWKLFKLTEMQQKHAEPTFHKVFM